MNISVSMLTAALLTLGLAAGVMAADAPNTAVTAEAVRGRLKLLEKPNREAPKTTTAITVDESSPPASTATTTTTTKSIGKKRGLVAHPYIKKKVSP